MKLNGIIQHDISFFNIYDRLNYYKCCYMCRSIIFKDLRRTKFPAGYYQFNCARCFYSHGYTKTIIIEQNICIDPVKYISI